MKPEGEAPKYAYGKVFKKRWFDHLSNQWKWCSRLGRSAIDSNWEGNLRTSELCRFGGTFGSVEAQFGHRRRPEEHFEMVPKESTVNPGGGGRHLSCISLRGARLKAQNTKEISTEIRDAMRKTARGGWNLAKPCVLHFGFEFRHMLNLIRGIYILEIDNFQII